jgi:hypothetical protein
MNRLSYFETNPSIHTMLKTKTEQLLHFVLDHQYSGPQIQRTSPT